MRSMKGHSFLVIVAVAVAVVVVVVLVSDLFLSLNPTFLVTIITFLQLSWTTGHHCLTTSAE